MVFADKVQEKANLLYFYILAPISIIALTQCASYPGQNRFCNLYPQIINRITFAYFFPNIVPYFYGFINKLPLFIHIGLIINGYVSIVAIILKLFYNRSRVYNLLFAEESLLKIIIGGSISMAVVSETGYFLQIIEIVQVLGFGYLFMKLRTNRRAKLHEKIFVFILVIVSILNLIQAFRLNRPGIIYAVMGTDRFELEDRSEADSAFMLM